VPAKPSGCAVIFAHGGIRRQMLPGFHYMDGVHASVRDESIPRQPRMRGPIGGIPQQHHARLRVPQCAGWGHAGASEMLDVAGGAKYLMARADVERSVGIGNSTVLCGAATHSPGSRALSELFSVGSTWPAFNSNERGRRAALGDWAFLDQWKAPIFLRRATMIGSGVHGRHKTHASS
jgi:hypothetical protein